MGVMAGGKDEQKDYHSVHDMLGHHFGERQNIKKWEDPLMVGLTQHYFFRYFLSVITFSFKL